MHVPKLSGPVTDIPVAGDGEKVPAQTDRTTWQTPWAPLRFQPKVSAPSTPLRPSWTSRVKHLFGADPREVGRTAALLSALLVGGCSSDTPPHQQAMVGAKEVAVSIAGAPWDQAVPLEDPDKLDATLRKPKVIQASIQRSRQLLTEASAVEPTFKDHAAKIDACLVKAEKTVAELMVHLGSDAQWLPTHLALSAIDTWVGHVENTLKRSKEAKAKPRAEDDYLACHDEQANGDATKLSFLDAYQHLAAVSQAFKDAKPNSTAACTAACLKMYEDLGRTIIDATHAPDLAGLQGTAWRWAKLVQEMEDKAQTIEGWTSNNGESILALEQQLQGLRLEVLGQAAAYLPAFPVSLLMHDGVGVIEAHHRLHLAGAEIEIARALLEPGVDRQRLSGALERAGRELEDLQAQIDRGWGRQYVGALLINALLFVFGYLVWSIGADERRLRTQRQNANDNQPPDTNLMLK